MLALLIVLIYPRVEGDNPRPGPGPDASRVYELGYNDEIGCSYMGAWLAHINLFRKVPFYMDICRAECASTELFKVAWQHRFVVKNQSTFYVNHISGYEHLCTKSYGFQSAANKTNILSSAAYNGECQSKGARRQINKEQNGVKRHSLALLPCYGGLPPTDSKHDKDSLGQGNSRVETKTKLTQCLATACSTLRYFGHVFIGVVRLQDRLMIEDVLRHKTMKHIASKVSIIEFRVSKPIILIFQLLVFAQHYVKIHNCMQFTRTNVDELSKVNREDSQTQTLHRQTQETKEKTVENDRENDSESTNTMDGLDGLRPNPNRRRRQLKKAWWKGQLKKLYFNESSIAVDLAKIPVKR